MTITLYFFICCCFVIVVVAMVWVAPRSLLLLCDFLSHPYCCFVASSCHHIIIYKVIVVAARTSPVVWSCLLLLPSIFLTLYDRKNQTNSYDFLRINRVHALLLFISSKPLFNDFTHVCNQYASSPSSSLSPSSIFFKKIYFYFCLP